jgi:ABC-type transport system involved in multi-copper enzyme maturation permease subunit
MKNIYVIARFTFKEFIKSKILISILALSFFLFLFTFITSELTYSTVVRVILDVGLGMATISAVGMAIFLGANLLSQEIENRTLYMVLSKGVTRPEFFIGKSLGLILFLLLSTFILGGQTFVLGVMKGWNFTPLYFWVCFFIFIESVMVLLLTILFSIITNRYLTIFFVFTLYTIGHSLDGALQSKMAKLNPFLAKMLSLFDIVLPMFYKLNFKDFLLYRADIDMNVLNLSLSYAFVYCLGLFLLNIEIFRKKDLD